MAYQRSRSAGKINIRKEEAIKELMKNCQRLLQPITVVRNPYAEALEIPAEVFKPRRTNSHYLQFIEAITFYKQYQRETKTDTDTGEIYIETTVEDIKEANLLMKEILLRKSDTLSGASRDHLERLKALLKEKKESTFATKEITLELRLPLSTVKRYHRQLLTGGYIKIVPSKEKEKALRYEIVSYQEYQELQGRISTALDQALSKIELLTGSVSVQSQSEPKKPYSRKGKSQRLNQSIK